MSRCFTAPLLRVLFHRSGMLVPPSELQGPLCHLTAHYPDEVCAFWSSVLTRLLLDEREAAGPHQALGPLPAVCELPITGSMTAAHRMAAVGSQMLN